MGNLTGWHALIILAVVILIFGAAKLPALAKSLGQSVKILKREVQTESSASSPATHADAGSKEPAAIATADPDGQAVRLD